MISFKLDVLPNQVQTGVLTENLITVEAASRETGYNLQYLRRLLRTGKLHGVKVGQIWLIELASLLNYFSSALSSNDMRFGPKGSWQPPF